MSARLRLERNGQEPAVMALNRRSLETRNPARRALTGPKSQTDYPRCTTFAVIGG